MVGIGQFTQSVQAVKYLIFKPTMFFLDKTGEKNALQQNNTLTRKGFLKEFIF
jgi:hypothetical protein